MKNPKYRTAYNILKQEIRDGEYKPGSLLPPEHMLETRFSISRTTVRRALELLSRDGYVDAKQGCGTVVLDFSAVQKLGALTSISETLRNQGKEVSTKSMHIDHVRAGVKVAEVLNVSEDDTVVRIQRVQFANGVPFCIMTNYLIESYVPGIERFVGQFTSLYELLEKQFGVLLDSAVEYLSAGVADFTEAQMLGVPVGSPLLISKRITCNSSGPIEYAISRILGDKYEYSVRMEGRPIINRSREAGE